jgi:hypothetical protein
MRVWKCEDVEARARRSMGRRYWDVCWRSSYWERRDRRGLEKFMVERR